MPQAPVDLDFLDFNRPSSPAQLRAAIKMASSDPARVRGALHSERGSVLCERNPALQFLLDSLSDVTIDLATRVVTAGAGTSLGGDPLAPGQNINPQFHEDRSLFYKLNERGLAAPVTGGITHQTLAGFLATGADGGSLTYSFPEAVLELTIVDANGKSNVFRRGDRAFDAALASLGLLGVVSEVKLQCEPNYYVIGLRSTQPDRDGDFALYEPLPSGQPTIVDFLRAKPYARALWWPQPGVERVELWEAMRFDQAIHGKLIKNQRPPPQSSGVPSPVLQLLARVVLGALAQATEQGQWPKQRLEKELAKILGADRRALLQKLAELYTQLDPSGPHQLTWREFWLVIGDIFVQLLGGAASTLWYPSPGSAATLQSDYPDQTLEQQLVAALIEMFVPLSPLAERSWVDWHDFPRAYSGQLFYDVWHKGLPMDNPIDDRILPVTFTEAWIPIANALPALTALHDMFKRDRLDATGTFAIELYAAKRSSAWLSPAHRGDVFRIDPFYFDNGDKIARDEFFTRYWSVLEPFEPCYHWGKALPPPTPERIENLAQRFPRLSDFLQLRQAMDPDGRFLTEYWRKHLGIP